MKINERTLGHIAQSAEIPVDQSGFLLSFSDDKKTLQKKWCVLKENLFFYYENRNDKEPLGAIILEGYRVEIVENSEHYYAFKIDFGVSLFGLQLKSYTFAAEHHADMERWVKCISCANYNYLKMVVCELQHRLDELNVLKRRESMSRRNAKKSVEAGESPSQRSNPFDSIEPEPSAATTFLELHNTYGLILRPYFQHFNGHQLEEQSSGEMRHNEDENEETFNTSS